MSKVKLIKDNVIGLDIMPRFVDIVSTQKLFSLSRWKLLMLNYNSDVIATKNVVNGL